ncbi:hypothetical protein HHI36_017400 [Cryptolaemus montrouzieri]|uniref:Uncharacterized protein n=1 Tax=Cryptolaemus montrouzieri TaxID=559131 RepID=A0ABD2NMQ2_9CUCU
MKNLNNILLLIMISQRVCGANILQNVIVNRQDSDNKDVDDCPEENCPTPSVSEALKAAEVLNLFVHSNFDDDTMKSIMSRLHNAVRTSY